MLSKQHADDKEDILKYLKFTYVWNTASCPGCLCSAIDHENLVNIFRRA